MFQCLSLIKSMWPLALCSLQSDSTTRFSFSMKRVLVKCRRFKKYYSQFQHCEHCFTMKIVSRLTLSSKKKKEVMARKLSVLEVIEEEKGILFAPLSSSITQTDKVRGWQAVLHRAKVVGLVAPYRDWKFIRDKVFSVWKSRTMVSVYC